jgi:hypothetical protein
VTLASNWERGFGLRIAQLLSDMPNDCAPSCSAFAPRLRLSSTEDAIGTWPTTATAIGVRPSGRQLEVWAPFGTDDLFNLVVRPNRIQITPAIYEAKVARWAARWPSLVTLGWEEGVGQPGLRRPDVAVRP